jgi:exonuclease SbcC
MDANQIMLNDARALIMKYESELSAREAVEKDIAEANTEKNRLQQDISDWTYLRNACGKNGLQAMEIDGAAPIITAFANDLLTQAFGPLFTVKFRTINEEGKECLDIIVISDDGEEILLDNLSGGQKIWCLMALRLAMTLLSKEKSGRCFASSFSDESDGALDPDNAINYIGMYRAFMNAGNFENLFFISHKPSCVALADNKLIFDKGKSPYWG